MIENSTATFTTVPKTPDEIGQLIADHLVLVDGQDGFATFGPFRSGPGYADVSEHTIYMAEGARGFGRGRALLAALEGAAAEQGVQYFIGGISGVNQSAVEFHRSCGYDVVGHLPGVGQKWGQRLDLVLVQKNLQD